MILLSDLNIVLPDRTLVTIGTFDGIHLGHQALISRMVRNAHAAGRKAVVVSFHPHPSVVLGKRQGNINITTPEERAGYLSNLGVDILVDQLFNETIATTSARNYVLSLKNSLNLDQLWVGHDFALGRNREGDLDFLRKLGEELGYDIVEVDPLRIDGEVVSSSQIRKLLWLGDVQKAAEFLGRPFKLTGEVIEGDQRGRTIGFPTANLSVVDDKLVPAKGVYACLINHNRQTLFAATNIGVRPTFDGKFEKLHVETHIVDYSGNLYGQELSLEFIQQLRGEKKFAGVPELVEQITKDIRVTREILQTYIKSRMTLSYTKQDRSQTTQ